HVRHSPVLGVLGVERVAHEGISLSGIFPFLDLHHTSVLCHWFRLMSDSHEQFCWTSWWCRVMLFRRAPSLLSGRDDDDIDPHAMPLLSWEERRSTAHLHYAMWRTTDPVPWCLLCTDFFSNTPYPSCLFENAHCHRGTSPDSPHRRGRDQRGD